MPLHLVVHPPYSFGMGLLNSGVVAVVLIVGDHNSQQVG